MKLIMCALLAVPAFAQGYDCGQMTSRLLSIVQPGSCLGKVGTYPVLKTYQVNMYNWYTTYTMPVQTVDVTLYGYCVLTGSCSPPADSVTVFEVSGVWTWVDRTESLTSPITVSGGLPLPCWATQQGTVGPYRATTFQCPCGQSQCGRYGCPTCSGRPGGTPIIVDVDGSGYQLTSEAGGVAFDLFANGAPIQVSWTALGSTNAFLALDLNGNGTIDSGRELFGNVSPQPACADPNGFLALDQYDANHDGVIDAQDPIYTSLLLWQDLNHDGVSQPNELHHLADLGITRIYLDYQVKKKMDEYGNQFRYRARVNDDGSKWAYDVILVTQ